MGPLYGVGVSVSFSSKVAYVSVMHRIIGKFQIRINLVDAPKTVVP